MALRSSMAHFQTFARLRTASTTDLPSIRQFRDRLTPELGLDDSWWATAVSRNGSYVLFATECQLVVGIGVLEHSPSAPEARIAYLCVTPDARGRGIGQLLLQTLVGRARSEGAAIVRAQDLGQVGLAKAMLRCGFAISAENDWSLGLWDGHAAGSYGALSIPDHAPVSVAEAPAQALLLAMGALDQSLLITQRARHVLQHEIGTNANALHLARSAAERGYFVWLDHLPQPVAAIDNPYACEHIISEESPVTPERVLGHLSRGHLCLVRLTIERLSNQRRWYIIDGFDGYLFRLHDVVSPSDRHAPEAITSAELRGMLDALPADNLLIIGRPL